MDIIRFEGAFKYHSKWMLIEADPEITKYLRHLFWINSFKTDKLNPPENRTHISVVSSYDNKISRYFEREHDSKLVEFDLLLNEFQDDGIYAWFKVRCPKAQEVRDELGLGQPHWPFHLTIGNRK